MSRCCRCWAGHGWIIGGNRRFVLFRCSQWLAYSGIRLATPLSRPIFQLFPLPASVPILVKERCGIVDLLPWTSALLRGSLGASLAAIAAFVAASLPGSRCQNTVEVGCRCCRRQRFTYWPHRYQYSLEKCGIVHRGHHGL